MTFETFKQLFLNLTQITVPYGSETMYYHGFLKHLIDIDLYQDGENFYYEVDPSNSSTLWCSHLDTACTTSEQVHHGFENNIIYSQRSTILGADNKAGVLAMIYLIYNNVPGTYYFFAGEEAGRVGSEYLAKYHGNYLVNFDRAIAFDRRGKGSLVSSQMGVECCSPQFVDWTCGRFKGLGLDFKDDPTGVYTDTASFMDLIPECTNISIGFEMEHSNMEQIDINYAWEVTQAVAEIDWEDSPVERVPTTFRSFNYIEKEDDLFKTSDKFLTKEEVDNYADADVHPFTL